MPDYTGRFTGRAGAYSVSRPSYPREVLQILKSEFGFGSKWTVADIGSGTGLLTRLFLDNGNRVFAVEPNEEMRQYAEHAFLDRPDFVSVNGKAESTGLPDSSVDLVASGQAFHWFEPDRARVEFRRILRDEKNVCIVYNNRDDNDPFMREYDMVVQRFARNRARVQEITEPYLKSWFGPGTFRRFTLRNEHYLDMEGLLGRLLSASYMPNEAETERFSALKTDATRLFDHYERNGRVRMLYETEISLGQA